MKIFVANLNPRTTADDLNKAFSTFGEIVSSKVVYDRETGNSKRYGFIEMTNAEHAKKAIEALNGSNLENNVIVVKESVPTEGNGQKNRVQSNSSLKFNRDSI